MTFNDFKQFLMKKFSHKNIEKMNKKEIIKLADEIFDGGVKIFE